MLFRIETVTVDYITIERPSRKEAQEYAKSLEKDYNQEHHHGEKTTVKVVYVPYK